MNQDLKKIKISLFLAICATNILSSCQSDKSESTFPLMADFYNRYVEDTRTFNTIGRIMYADSLAMGESDTTHYGINVNGIDLKRNQDAQNRIQYSGRKTMDLNSDLNIQIANQKHEIIAFASKITPVSNVVTEGKFTLEQGGKITWEGELLKDHETIIVMITDEVGQSSSTTIQGPTTNRSVVITASLLEGLKKGTGEYYIVRTGNDHIEKDQFDMQIRNEFFSRSKPLNIE